MSLNLKTLHKKRARKEAKRNLKRKAFRIKQNNWRMLGKAKQQDILGMLHRQKIVAGIISNVNGLIDQNKDKIDSSLLEQIETYKTNLKACLRNNVIDGMNENIKFLSEAMNEVLKKINPVPEVKVKELIV